MKKTLFYSAAALCGMALMFTACDKDDDNNDSEEFLGGKGHILLENGRVDDAEETFKKAIVPSVRTSWTRPSTLRAVRI